MSDEPKILSVNVRHYPNMNDLYTPVKITTVLVEGDIGDYAAYSGAGNPVWVARFGDKISFKEATCHFFGIEEAKYRI